VFRGARDHFPRQDDSDHQAIADRHPDQSFVQSGASGVFDRVRIHLPEEGGDPNADGDRKVEEEDRIDHRPPDPAAGLVFLAKMLGEMSESDFQFSPAFGGIDQGHLQIGNRVSAVAQGLGERLTRSDSG
jgi:hypothetical protein